MNTNFRLFINGEQVIVNGVSHSNNGFVNVYVNGNASCHSFPAHFLTKAQFNIYYACHNHGTLIGLTNEQITDCFVQWLDAVENSGVTVEDNNTFKAAFVDSLNDHKEFNT